MPYIHIQVTDEGVTQEQKQTLIKDSTQMMVDLLGKDPATTFVVISEVSTDNWGVSGQSVTQIRAQKHTS